MLYIIDRDNLAGQLHEYLNKIAPYQLDRPSEYDKKEFYEIFERVYKESLNENYFWQWCPFSVYESHFKVRITDYLKINLDAREKDFINNEIHSIKSAMIKTKAIGSLKKTIKIKYNFADRHKDEQVIELEDYAETSIINKVAYGANRKLEFLMEKLNALKQPKVYEQPELYLDFSNNSDAEKIVFLHELGILDYLRKKEPFISSINKLAEVISSFTGINQSTAQSYINPIISKGVDTKNSPLNSKNQKSVSEKLIKMGYINKK